MPERLYLPLADLDRFEAEALAEEDFIPAQLCDRLINLSDELLLPFGELLGLREIKKMLDCVFQRCFK